MCATSASLRVSTPHRWSASGPCGDALHQPWWALAPRVKRRPPASLRTGCTAGRPVRPRKANSARSRASPRTQEERKATDSAHVRADREWAVPGSNGRPPACKARAGTAVCCRLSLSLRRERWAAHSCCVLMPFVASKELPHEHLGVRARCRDRLYSALRGVLVGVGQGCRCPACRWRTAWPADASFGIVIAKRISVVEVVGDTEPQPVDSHDDQNHDG